MNQLTPDLMREILERFVNRNLPEIGVDATSSAQDVAIELNLAQFHGLGLDRQKHDLLVRCFLQLWNKRRELDRNPHLADPSYGRPTDQQLIQETIAQMLR